MRKFCLIYQDPKLYRNVFSFLLSLLPLCFGFFYYWWCYNKPFYFFSIFLVAPQFFGFYILSGVILSCWLTPVLEKFFIFLLKKLSIKYQYFFCIFFSIIDVIINKYVPFFIFFANFFMFLFYWIFIQLSTVFLLPDDTGHYPLFTFKELSILVNEKYFVALGMHDSWTFEDIVFLSCFLMFLLFITGLLCCVLEIQFWRLESISKNYQNDGKRFYYEGETFYYKRAALLLERKLAGVVEKYRFSYFYYFCLVCEWLLIFFFFFFFFFFFPFFFFFNFFLFFFFFFFFFFFELKCYFIKGCIQ